MKPDAMARGQISLEYLLVVAVLVLALAVSTSSLSSHFIQWYQGLVKRVAVP